MPGRSASPPSEPRGAEAPLESLAESWRQHLVGVGSSKPTYYAAWRRQSHNLDRSLESFRSISNALGTTTKGPRTLCDAVLAAVAQHFHASWAAISFESGAALGDLPPLILHPASRDWRPLQETVSELTQGALSQPGLVWESPGSEAAGSGRAGHRGVGVVLLRNGLALGALVLVLKGRDELSVSDVSFLETLAHQMGSALENAQLFQELQRRTDALNSSRRELGATRLQLRTTRHQTLLAQEREWVTRELHDRVAQHVASIGLNLEWCRSHLAPESPIAERLTATQELARSALREIRATIDQLTTQRVPTEGPVLTIAELADELRRATGLCISCEDLGEVDRLPTAIRRSLNGIVQEALFNIVRHSGATHAWVCAHREGGAVYVEVSDDGRGDAASIDRQLLLVAGGRNPGHCHGLSSMVARAMEVRGQVRARPRAGGGVVIRVFAPRS